MVAAIHCAAGQNKSLIKDWMTSIALEVGSDDVNAERPAVIRPVQATGPQPIAASVDVV